MEIEEGVIRRGRRLTPSSISIILHMIRKPNSIIVLLFIQNNSQFKNNAKTCLPPSMLSSPSIVRVQGCLVPQIFSKQQTLPFALCSCCSCHVFRYNFAQFLLLKRVKCPPFFVFTTKTTQPRTQVFLVNGALTRRQPRPQSLLAFQYGGGRREDPSTKQKSRDRFVHGERKFIQNGGQDKE